jgi:hypothetical protein
VTFFVTEGTLSCRARRENSLSGGRCRSTCHVRANAQVSGDPSPASRVCDHERVEEDPRPGADPVLERRRRIAGLVSLGQRVGYGLFGVAMALFVVGLVAGFGGAVSGGIVAAIVVGSIVLAPAIVFGYAVKAAERDDREQGRPTLD